MALYAVSTTDGGKSWRHTLVQDDYSQMVMPGITAVGCMDGGGFCVAVGKGGTIAVTRDGGLHWSPRRLTAAGRSGPLRAPPACGSWMLDRRHGP